MTDDEEEIRDLPVKWMAATKRGDIDALLDLMTADAIFLTPGNAPMDRDLFRKIASGQSGDGMPEFDAESEVQEVQVMGDHAFMWTRLRVTVTPRKGEPVARSGHTMTILRKENGKWRLARDANLLAMEKSAEPSRPVVSPRAESPGFPDLDPDGLIEQFSNEPVWYIWNMDEDGHVMAIAGRCQSREAAEEHVEELKDKKPGGIFAIQKTRAIVPDRTLPTEGQIRQLCEVLQRALVTIRSLAYHKDPETIARFADMLHNLPTEMYDERMWDWNALEYSFMSFVKSNPGKAIYNYPEMVREIRYGPGGHDSVLSRRNCSS